MKTRTRKSLRVATLVVVGLVTLIALAVAIENWRGKRAWETARREIEGRGETLSFAPFIPPLVPDDQNFLMTPLLAPLFGPDAGNHAGELNKRLALGDSQTRQPGFGNWRTGQHIELDKWATHLGQPDLRQALKKNDAEMTEITAASRRPFSRAPLDYSGNLFSTATPHLGPLRQLAKLYALRAEAELAQGRPDAAVDDVLTLLRVAESQKNSPFLIGQLIRYALLQQGLQVVWEGQSTHRLSDSQLATLQRELEAIDPLSGMVASLRAERAAMTEYFSSLLTGGWVYHSGMPIKIADLGNEPLPAFGRIHSALTPRCVLYQNLVSANRFYERLNLTGIDADRNRVYPGKMKFEDDEVANNSQLNLYTAFTRGMIPSFIGTLRRSAFAQTACNQAALACALERYRLAHGEYPESLGPLVPEYSRNLPHDVITGEPLKYRRTVDGGFILYSVGWNETDEGGQLATKEPASEDGDWGWAVKGSE